MGTSGDQQEPVEVVPPLDQMRYLHVDENNIWYRPEYPRYDQDLAPAKPFLVPSFDSDDVVEILPSEKQNRKIRFDEQVHVMEIENRWQLMEPEDIDDDESYEIEIVEGGDNNEDDADFYLEMIDGEIFYVFETEDDISVDDDDECESESGSSESDETETESGPVAPLQLNFGDMMVPNIGEFDISEMKTPTLPLPTMDVPPDTVEIESCSNNFDMSSFHDSTANHSVDATSTGSEQQQQSPNVAISAPSSPPRISQPMSPQSPTKPTVTAKFDTPPVSPQRSVNNNSPGTPTTPRSILKASVASPIKSPSKKKRDKKAKKKEKGEKTFTKTFVRATDFDGEHRVYSWAKPAWTNKQLKSTGKGDAIRSGENLAEPITDAKQLIEKGKVKWEKPEWAISEEPEQDKCAKEELIKQIQEGGMQLPGLQNNKRRLKLSINGSILADGGDIVKPITKATIIKKPSNVNYVANPKILRATKVGKKLWKGENLAGPVTSATTEKKYEWEKPDWVKPKLHTTKTGEMLKAGTDVAAPITRKKDWEKPDWTEKRGIGRTKSEMPVQCTRKEYSWEKPSWVKARLRTTSTEEGALKETDKGQMLRNGENLAMPITQLPHMKTSASFDEEDRSKGSPKQRRLRRTTSFD